LSVELIWTLNNQRGSPNWPAPASLRLSYLPPHRALSSSSHTLSIPPLGSFHTWTAHLPSP
jgi:hypothetical protein